jgi:hypothetical protein
MQPEQEESPESPESSEQRLETEREKYLRRQHDVYTAAKASAARHHLRDVRRLALRGQYSYNEVRRARREYYQAKAQAPTVWQWAPQRDTPKAA